MRDFTRSDDFWESFVATHWEKQPVLLKNVFSQPIVTKEEVFSSILSKPKSAGSDRFWVSQNSKGNAKSYRMVDITMFGPKATDGGIDGFFERIRKNLGDREVGLNVHNLQLGSPELWFRFRDFIHGLIEKVGLPTQQWDIDTFLGTYGFTPFGIHTDNASVFALGVMGRRTYYAWPNDYFQKGDPALHTPDQQLVGPHLEHAIRMELGPGDIAYWPSSHWHVVGSDRQPSVVVQVSAYFGVEVSKMIGHLVTQVLNNRLEQDHCSLYDLAEGLPEVLQTASSVLTGLCETGTIEHQLQRSWLVRRSADGFPNVPELAEPATLPSSVRINARRPIHCLKGPQGLVVAANGHLFQAPLSALNLLERLHTSEKLLVTEVGPGERQLLQDLVRARAFES